jgi:hypothetical protein
MMTVNQNQYGAVVHNYPERHKFYWKLLLVDLAKMQYTRDGEGPEL